MTNGGEGLARGTRLEEFEIERELGAGGFGVTYLARDVSLATWRAVKEYLPREWGQRRGDGTVGPRTGADAEDYRWGLERFLEEARILARFDHRNVVRVYRVFEGRGTAYMVTEYVEGRTLKAEAAGGRLPEGRVRAVLGALAEGLEQVHAAGLLHRDIKPENVMVRADGTPVLIDFGAARQAMGQHSRSMTAVLTPGYAPIEQYSVRGRQGPWTDIYALGAVGYWALSGAVPDDAVDRLEEDRVRPLAEVARGEVSEALAWAVDAALVIDRAQRPQSVRQWRSLLEESARRAAANSPGADGGESPVLAGRAGEGAASWKGRWGVMVAAVLTVGAAVLALMDPEERSATEISADTRVQIASDRQTLTAGTTREFGGMEFVWIPAGEFEMGSESEYAMPNEWPVMRVRISKGYWLGKHEVTQGQWQEVMRSNPSEFSSCGSDCPVERVSWEDVQEFIGRLNEQAGTGQYRLPTEAEWEYAARAGSRTDTYAGDLSVSSGKDPVLEGIAWYDQNSGGRPHLVGGKRANSWGLHDMLGNVREWVADRYGDYSGRSVTDPRGDSTERDRVVRSCDWAYGISAACRAATREGLAPDSRLVNLGFRLARTK